MSDGRAFNLAIKFETIECCAKGCHVLFAVSAELQAQLRKADQSFYCPHGHSQSYRGKSEEEQLRDQLAQQKANSDYYESRAKAARAEAKMVSYQLRAEKGAKTKLKKRIAAGVRPCCTRSFQNLKAHMKTQHPDFTNAEQSL